MLHQAGYLIPVRIKLHTAVLEIIDSELVPVIPGLLFTAHSRHSARIMGEYSGKGILLHVFIQTVVRVTVHIFGPVRKLETGEAVTGGVDVLCRAQGNQTRKELYTVTVLRLCQ